MCNRRSPPVLLFVLAFIVRDRKRNMRAEHHRERNINIVQNCQTPRSWPYERDTFSYSVTYEQPP